MVNARWDKEEQSGPLLLLLLLKFRTDKWLETAT